MRREDIPSCSYATADFESQGGRMESNLGKVFIGGISWDTNEDCLREYFEKFGEVVEAVIKKDRNTGRARGFGFVAFANPAVAEWVVMTKHRIDGRMVEAKKAIPRDDRHILLNRTNNSLLLHGSPGLSRTRKIFVGGLPSNITEADFKNYFERFGAITDAVVMYDHNTHRPRGFGFITFNSKDVVDRVLHNTFYELNGKMVEVKRAIPKEFSPGHTKYGLNRFNNPSSLGCFGLAIGGRNGSPFDLNLSSNIVYEQALNPYYSGSLTRFAGSSNPGPSFDLAALNLWDNDDYNIIPASANSFAASRIGRMDGFNINNINWQGLSSPHTTHAMCSGSDFTNRNLNYGTMDYTFGFSSDICGRSNDIGSFSTSFTTTRNYMDSYESGSIYRDLHWHSRLNELDGSSSFDYGLDAITTDEIFSGLIDNIHKWL